MYDCFQISLLIYTETSRDYGGISTFLSFMACDTRQCIEVPIVNDNLAESTVEYFTVHMGRHANLNPRITLDHIVTTVEIFDEGMQLGMSPCV